MNSQMEKVLKDVWASRNMIMHSCPPVDATRPARGPYIYEDWGNPKGAKLIEANFLSPLEYMHAELDVQDFHHHFAGLAEVFRQLNVQDIQLSYDGEYTRETHTIPVADILQIFVYGQQINDNLYAAQVYDSRRIYESPTVTASVHPVLNLDLKRHGTHRVYLNLKFEGRNTILLALLRKVWNVVGVVGVEVRGPGNDHADTVTIYCVDAAVSNAVIEAIRGTARRHPGFFRPTIKPLTSPVRGFTGVSTGVKPPEMTVMKRDNGYAGQWTENQSFMKFRAELIFMALERTVRPTTKTVKSRWFNTPSYRSFKLRCARYMEEAGIDPNRPGHQGQSAHQRDAQHNRTQIMRLRRRFGGN